MSEILLISLMVFVAFVGAFSLAEWAASHWVDLGRQRAQGSDAEIPHRQNRQERD